MIQTRRKVQKAGNAKAIALTSGMAEALGVEFGDELIVRLVGHSLVIHKEGTAALGAEELRLAAEAAEASTPPPEPLRALDAHLVATIHEHGPIRTVDVAKRVTWSRTWTSVTLHRLAADGWVEKHLGYWVLGPVGRGWVEAATSDNLG